MFKSKFGGVRMKRLLLIVCFMLLAGFSFAGDIISEWGKVEAPAVPEL